MVSAAERFWISFILRFAFGFLFLFAALNIFSYGPDKFATDLYQPFANTWVGGIEGADKFFQTFLYGMPYVMAALSVPILTGIFARPALRLGALLLVCLGLGKYIQNDITTTAADFLFALMILLGLFITAKDRTAETPAHSEYTA